MVGLLLAFLNFLASTFISSKVIHRSKLTSILIALGGFLTRLTALGLIFYGLTWIKEIHFQTTLLSFATGFTLFLIIKTLRFYRKLGSISWKHIGR